MFAKNNNNKKLTVLERQDTSNQSEITGSVAAQEGTPITLINTHKGLRNASQKIKDGEREKQGPVRRLQITT